ncbi:MAG: hypothetical protein LM590_13050 [Thermofilum sp.]|nr:hypothetical protein [Thermofilum sp.]MCC6065674.1 hypothetical protein [Thermofilum sp.]
MWKVAIASYLPPEEAISRPVVYFSSYGWSIYQVDNVYIAEDGARYLSLSISLVVIGGALLAGGIVVLNPSSIAAGLLLLAIGLILLNEKHSIALKFEQNTYLVAANSYEAFREILRFAEAIGGKLLHAETPTTPFIEITLPAASTAKAIKELETRVLRRIEALSSTQLKTQPAQGRKEILEELNTYQGYLEKLERLKAEGKITERAYTDLKNEYTQKIAELQKQLQYV